jgi:hypothetical protein
MTNEEEVLRTFEGLQLGGKFEGSCGEGWTRRMQRVFDPNPLFAVGQNEITVTHWSNVKSVLTCSA